MRFTSEHFTSYTLVILISDTATVGGVPHMKYSIKSKLFPFAYALLISSFGLRKDIEMNTMARACVVLRTLA